MSRAARKFTEYDKVRKYRDFRKMLDEQGNSIDAVIVAIPDFLHATILHLLGMDHTKLTYFYNGRNMRLTDVYGDPIPQIVSS